MVMKRNQAAERAEEPAERAKHAKKKGGSARMRSREGMPIRDDISMGVRMTIGWEGELTK